MVKFAGKSGRTAALKFGNFRLVCLLMSAMLFCLMSADAQKLILGWDPSADTNVIGYALYYGPTSGDYLNRIDVGTNTTAVMTGLSLGAKYYFAVTAYNSAGLESPVSNEVLFSTYVRLQLLMNPGPAAGMTLNFNAFSGHSYSVQASSDMHNWTNLWQSSVLTNNSSLSYTDNTPKDSLTNRFYRIMVD